MSENERKGKSPEIARPRRDAVSARKPVDARPRLEEDPRRFVLDHLLYFFRVPYVMLSAYLDESGTHDASLPMCVAGILYDRAAVRRLDRAGKRNWNRLAFDVSTRLSRRTYRVSSKARTEGSRTRCTYGCSDSSVNTHAAV